jgi:rhamnose transport system ATP-binding protein
VTPLVELRAITKRFGPVQVLTEVDLDLHAGRVHSLAGENGAGKSTLVKILGGIHQPDSGRMLIDGAEVAIRGAADAQRHGMAVIHQHPTVFPDLSVAENVFIGRQPVGRGRIDWVAMRAEARELLARLSMPIDVRTPVKMLGIAERQTIEIVRALSLDARVLIMDEPTSAISSSEVDRLFEIVLRLKRQGVAILFISHFIDEILRMGDDVTILRSGRRVITCPGAELTPEQTVRHMVGTDLAAFFPKEAAVIGAPVASVKGLSGAGFVEGVTFDLRAGEILGFFGLVGAGRSEVAQMLFGITPPTGGEIRIDGRPVRPPSPRHALQLGISLLPEDRHYQGLVLEFPIRANETLPVLRRLANRLGMVDRRAEAKLAEDFAGRMRVVASGIEQLTNTLSGGNQQKVLLARWLCMNPKLLILDEPTRGIDVGAKAEILSLIRELAGQGLAVLMISSELEEVVEAASRIFVLRDGHMAAELKGDAVNEQTVMAAMAHGQEKAQEAADG